MAEYSMIPAVEAGDFPPEVEAWFDKHDYSTHYQNEVVWVDDDGNTFATWLKSIGVEFGGKDHIHVAVYAT